MDTLLRRYGSSRVLRRRNLVPGNNCPGTGHLMSFTYVLAPTSFTERRMSLHPMYLRRCPFERVPCSAPEIPCFPPEQGIHGNVLICQAIKPRRQPETG